MFLPISHCFTCFPMPSTFHCAPFLSFPPDIVLFHCPVVCIHFPPHLVGLNIDTLCCICIFLLEQDAYHIKNQT